MQASILEDNSIKKGVFFVIEHVISLRKVVKTNYFPVCSIFYELNWYRFEVDNLFAILPNISFSKK